MTATTNDNSESKVIVHKDGGFVFSGEGATDLFRIISLKSALKLLKVGLKPTRGFTKTYGLKLAGEYTKKTYKRTEIDQALTDLEEVIKQKQKLIPVERK